ncbi:glycosyltransferase family 9 protein [Methylophilaceae bacterium]|nr:glycosyltransferase family 9 protein [Methylophilaceae bacterium]
MMRKILVDKDVEKILFITLSNIGDVILTTPTLESLHFKFPNATFDIVGDKRSKLLFKYCPYMNNFYEKDKDAGWYGVLLLIKRLREKKYDLAVDLRSDGILYFVKARNKIFKASNRSSLRMHSVEKHFLSLKTVVENNPPLTNIWLSDYEKELATKILSKYNHSLTIGVGANFEGKIWDVSKYIELAKLLKNFFDVIILVGDKNDITISKEFISGYNGKIINCCGHYNLLETTAIIKKSDFFIGNDSGLGHIASAVKTKSFTIFGVGQPYRYRPWNNEAFWVQDENHKINNIEPKIVAKLIIDKLK